MKNISRRDFLKGSAATVAGAAALGLLGACSTNDAPAASTTEEKFDKECDFLIVGYGLAGDSARVTAKPPRWKPTTLIPTPRSAFWKRWKKRRLAATRSHLARR